jgi:hypothetical protein
MLKVHAGQAGRWNRVSALWARSIEGCVYFGRLIFCFWGVNLSVLGLAVFVHHTDNCTFAPVCGPKQAHFGTQSAYFFAFFFN